MNDLRMANNQKAAVLEQVLDNAQTIIHKSYLERLDELTVVLPSNEISDIDITECGRFYRLDRLVVNSEENFLDKLVTIANAVAPIGCSLATVVDSDGIRIRYYIGVVAKLARQDNERDIALRQAGADTFSGAVKGNFSGSTLHELSSGETGNLRRRLFDKPQSVAAVSGIVSLRNKDDKNTKAYVQGLENLTNAMQGKAYTIVMIADPVNSSQIRKAKQGYEMLYTHISHFQGCSMTINESQSFSLSNAQTEGITAGISEGISRSQSHSMNRNHSTGSSSGSNTSMTGGLPFGVLSLSAGMSTNTNKSDTIGRTDSTSIADSTTRSRSVNMGHTLSVGSGSEQGRSMQISMENRSIKNLMDKIDLHLDRLDAAENFGGFECATYVLADSREGALSVAGHYNALMRGDDSFVQSSQVTVWSPKRSMTIAIGDSPVERIARYLRAFSHPEFYLDNRQKNSVTVRPSSLVSGKEIAIQFAFPKKSVHGLTVLEMTPFGRNVPSASDGTIDLGALYFMGCEESTHTSVPLSIDSLAAHTFVTGSTGSGKSNTLYQMLHELNQKGIKFLVVEPTKGEYKDVFGGCPGVSVWGTNPFKTPILRINPFAFPNDIHVLEHIDRLIEIFNACWPMYAAMPAILKDAVEMAYRNVGWDLRRSCNARKVFPTFEDLLSKLPSVIEDASYSHDTSSDYKGALVTRVKSLTTGIFGQIFCEDDIPGEVLFEENTIVDLSRVGSTETKALLMGMLILKLQEYRMAGAVAMGRDAKLRHVTVLEEAHNLLRRTSMEQTQDGTNLLGKSVEMLAHSIAEMRTYGEGFIIADQSPGLLDLSVIRNTNTKIILRLPDENDRQLVGKAAGLSDGQIAELARLERGVAAVSQSGWLEAVLCRISHYTNQEPFVYHPAIDEMTPIRKFAECAVGYTERLELTKEEADNLKRWRDGLRCEAEDLAYVDAVIGDSALGNQTGGYLLYLLFDGNQLLRGLLYDGNEESDAYAIKKIDMDIAERFGYDSPDHRAVAYIRVALCGFIQDNTILEEETRKRIERILLLERGGVHETRIRMG